jgi:hypothetical protein
MPASLRSRLGPGLTARRARQASPLRYFSMGTLIELPHSVQEPS